MAGPGYAQARVLRGPSLARLARVGCRSLRACGQNRARIVLMIEV